MLNAFPQSTADLRGLLLTYDEALTGLNDDAICAAARKFTSGQISGHNQTFSPSVAEFCAEVRRTPVPGAKAISGPHSQTRGFEDRQQDAGERMRMRLKMPLYNAAMNTGRIEELVAALDQGFAATAALAINWGVPVPEEFSRIPDEQIEREWQTARQRARMEIERNPPPFRRHRNMEAESWT